MTSGKTKMLFISIIEKLEISQQVVQDSSVESS